MYRIMLAMGLATVGLTAQGADVGVTINVGEPGFYGQITLGSSPPPQLVYRQPVIIERVRGVAPPPIYLHVPPGHAKHWSQHCRQYAACGRPVFFVQDRWYNDVYVPHYREHGERRDDDRGEGHHDKDDRGRKERDRHRRDHDD